MEGGDSPTIKCMIADHLESKGRQEAPISVEIERDLHEDPSLKLEVVNFGRNDIVPTIPHISSTSSGSSYSDTHTVKLN